jgi:hypothetical protein
LRSFPVGRVTSLPTALALTSCPAAPPGCSCELWPAERPTPSAHNACNPGSSGRARYVAGGTSVPARPLTSTEWVSRNHRGYGVPNPYLVAWTRFTDGYATPLLQIPPRPAGPQAGRNRSWGEHRRPDPGHDGRAHQLLRWMAGRGGARNPALRAVSCARRPARSRTIEPGSDGEDR